MKTIIAVLATIFLLSACSAEVGSEEWCNELKESNKADWTSREAKDFTKHCIF